MKKKLTIAIFFLISIVMINSVDSIETMKFSLIGDPWVGVGSDWRVLNKPTNLTFQEVLDYWRNDIEKYMKNWNFNTVRLGFAFPNAGNTTRNKLNFEELNQILNLFDSYGIKVILDLHNYEDMEGYFGSDVWINSWVELAQIYKTDDRIVAYEIFNEPFGQDKPSRINTWDPSVTGGGAGVYDETEAVAAALAKCVDAIRATRDNHIIVYPGPWWFRPSIEETYDPQTFLESSYSRDNIIITIHSWFLWENQTQEKMNEFYSNQIEKIEAWADHYPIWIGEFGAASINGPPSEIQKEFSIKIVDYARSEGIGFNYWIARENIVQRQEKWNLVEEAIQPPEASFTYLPINPQVNETINFDSSNSIDPNGIIVVNSWDFGDGQNSTIQNPTHSYSEEGKYNVSLTVTDDNSLKDIASTIIVIPEFSSFAILFAGFALGIAFGFIYKKKMKKLHS